MVKQQGKPLVSLSAQQLMDCSGSYGNYGCSGGYMTYAYKYIADKGVTTDSSYPYKGAYQKCAFDGGEYTIKGFKEMKDCTAIANALYNIPIAVAVDASKFYNYKSGVFSDCSPSPQLNHAFALVGLTNDYWLGKEQWGLKFGENGYIRIAKAGSACGICQMASYPF
jgi:cathepsin L